MRSIGFFSIVLPPTTTEKEPIGRTKEWPLATVGLQKKETRQEARGNGTGLRSIDLWIDRLQKNKRKRAAGDRLFFLIVLPPTTTEKEPRGQTKEWPLATVGLQKKETRQEAIGDGTCLRSIDLWIDRPQKKERKRAACDRLVFFRSSCHQQRQRRSQSAEQKNGRLRR